MVNLAATGLLFQYQEGVRALAGIDVEVCAGELHVIIGPNGSGKSTLLQCLAGLLTPQSGEVRLDDRPLAQIEVRERARSIAVVPQFLPALPDVRVDRFVLSGRYAQFSRWSGPGDADVTAATEALRAADVAELADRRMDEISGGQRQRVLLARALAQGARTLLIDEPTNALDPEHQIGVFDQIRRLADGGTGVAVVTHDLALASQFADRLTLLDGGRVAATGPVSEVMTPETLTPIYGGHLYFGDVTVAEGKARRFVIPWRPA